MLTPLDCLSIFGISLLLSTHCMGMCGGFALALSRGVEGRGALALRQASYSVGRITTYLLLGTLAGLFGLAVTARPSLRFVAFALSLAAGLTMIGLGLHQLGWTRRFDWHAKLAPPRLLSDLMTRVSALRDPLVPYALGLLTGLLPCGLVIGWLMKAAASGSPFDGLLTMTFFGLGTVPAMFAMGFAPGFLSVSARARLVRLGAVALIAFGLYQCYRGVPGLLREPTSHLHHAHSHEDHHSGEMMH